MPNLAITVLISLTFSIVFTLITKKLALKYRIIDQPDKDRRFHKDPTPLLGGVAIFLSFFLTLYIFRDYLVSGDLNNRHWVGFFIGSLFLIFGGFLDDKFKLAPRFQIIFPLLASLSVVFGGVGIEKITNPFGGYLFLSAPVSAFLIIAWLLGMTYTTKLLDGVDGLVTGVATIGSLIIFLFTITTKYYQPDIGLAALVLSASSFGFLIFNFNPAKIFLGEGGSLFLGFALGVLAIISGGKIAIALLVMGIPMMDVVWTILRRLKEGKNPFKFSDRKHLHFRLLDAGLSQKQTVLVFYLFSLVFGLSALFLQSTGKIFLLGVLVLIMFIFIASFNYFDKKKSWQS